MGRIKIDVMRAQQCLDSASNEVLRKTSSTSSFPFALFHPRELSALFASTAHNGRTQESLGIGLNGNTPLYLPCGFPM
jgi:hypothetical protein